jgi:two-component system, OmpR family, phosphate regulon sensor histidine kinase PhoR
MRHPVEGLRTLLHRWRGRQGLAPILTTAPAVGTGVADEVRLSPSPDLPIWRVMLDGIIDPAVVLDESCAILAANGAARDTMTIVAGRHIAQTNRSPDLVAATERALTTGETQVFDVRLLVPVERLLSGKAIPLQPQTPRSKDGPAVLLVWRDLSERDQLVRLRADFVANASHELRTPLASLKGYVETLQGSASDDPVARRKFLPIMLAEADRMSRLIDDLLSLSRIEMRERVTPRDAVDLASVVAEVATILRPLADAAGQSILMTPLPAQAPVIGDRDELLQVVHNLIQNAIRYGKPGGRIDISLYDVGDRTALSVADDGIGIAEQHLPRLTERFYRVSAKDSRARGGTGLGLAIVKHIVNRHRGELAITSTPGKGSEFTVALPRAAET